MLIEGEKVWKWHATLGIPLEVTIPILGLKGYYPTWDRLILEALKDGADPKRLIRRLQGVVIDIYPKEVAKVIVSGLNELIGKREKTPDVDPDV